jgi:hypothetical protein
MSGVPSDTLNLLPGVPADYVLERLAKAGGKEIETGKFASPESSAALAVNMFGWFTERPSALPSFPGVASIGTPLTVDVEYCARFPWSGGRHPWLDAAIITSTHIVGVESKRFEPFRGHKAVSLSDAYNRPVWGDRMGQFERLRDNLRNGVERFRLLDAAQLIKHAFGLVTEARRRQLKPALVYLYAEPPPRPGRTIDPAMFELHRQEIARFADFVAGAEVTFAAVSYRSWLASWPSDGDVAAHGRNVLARFDP